MFCAAALVLALAATSARAFVYNNPGQRYERCSSGQECAPRGRALFEQVANEAVGDAPPRDFVVVADLDGEPAERKVPFYSERYGREMHYDKFIYTATNAYAVTTGGSVADEIVIEMNAAVSHAGGNCVWDWDVRQLSGRYWITVRPVQQFNLVGGLLSALLGEGATPKIGGLTTRTRFEAYPCRSNLRKLCGGELPADRNRQIFNECVDPADLNAVAALGERLPLTPADRAELTGSCQCGKADRRMGLIESKGQCVGNTCLCEREYTGDDCRTKIVPKYTVSAVTPGSKPGDHWMYGATRPVTVKIDGYEGPSDIEANNIAELVIIDATQYIHCDSPDRLKQPILKHTVAPVYPVDLDAEENEAERKAWHAAQGRSTLVLKIDEIDLRDVARGSSFEITRDFTFGPSKSGCEPKWGRYVAALVTPQATFIGATFQLTKGGCASEGNIQGTCRTQASCESDETGLVLENAHGQCGSDEVPMICCGQKPVPAQLTQEQNAMAMELPSKIVYDSMSSIKVFYNPDASNLGPTCSSKPAANGEVELSLQLMPLGGDVKKDLRTVNVLGTYKVADMSGKYLETDVMFSSTTSTWVQQFFVVSFGDDCKFVQEVRTQTNFCQSSERKTRIGVCTLAKDCATPGSNKRGWKGEFSREGCDGFSQGEYGCCESERAESNAGFRDNGEETLGSSDATRTTALASAAVLAAAVALH